ncbi:MAG TPA: hypothetical protein VHF46_00330 [Rubrobacteraceae bacterium]|nr:hypothetical protein [Rubrobacteraceae bacterium]
MEVGQGAAEGVTASFQKTQPGGERLKAEILVDELVVESTTYAEFGSIILGWLLFMALLGGGSGSFSRPRLASGGYDPQDPRSLFAVELEAGGSYGQLAAGGHVLVYPLPGLSGIRLFVGEGCHGPQKIGCGFLGRHFVVAGDSGGDQADALGVLADDRDLAFDSPGG